MPKCEQCGKEVDLPFECNFCGGHFCIEHRLPENHNCPNQPARTPLGSWQTKKETVYSHPKKQTGEFASEGDYHFTREESTEHMKEESTKQPYEKRSSYGLYVKGTYRRIGFISCVICGIILSIVGLPFAVKYQSTTVLFLGEYQLHSVTLLGSPIYTWSTWNGMVGPLDFFIAFILNTLTCFIIFWILTAMH
jgi:hypothetical protein